MKPFETNTDPKKRVVLFGVFSQKQSVQTGWGLFETTCAEVEKSCLQGKSSEVLRAYYNNPQTIDKLIIGCIYEKPDGSLHRRFTHVPMPESDEELKEVLTMFAETLGIKIKLHEFIQKMGVGKVRAVSRVVPEQKIFFDELIEMSTGKVKSEIAHDQLEKLSQKLLHDMAGYDDRIQSDTVGYALAGMLQHYVNEKDNLYRVAPKFGGHLADTTIRIPTKHLKVVWPVLLEFPFTFKLSETEYLRNAIISDGSGSAGLIIIAPIYKDKVWDGRYVECFWAMHKEKIIEDIRDDFKTNSEYDLKEFLLYTLKCLVYINSAEPDLVNTTAPVCEKKNPAKRRKFYKSICPYNITNIGYAFHGRTYSIDETSVVGHYRWQPCGPEKSQVKLIWIDEHSRTYGKD